MSAVLIPAASATRYPPPMPRSGRRRDARHPSRSMRATNGGHPFGHTEPATASSPIPTRTTTDAARATREEREAHYAAPRPPRGVRSTTTDRQRQSARATTCGLSDRARTQLPRDAAAWLERERSRRPEKQAAELGGDQRDANGWEAKTSVVKRAVPSSGANARQVRIAPQSAPPMTAPATAWRRRERQSTSARADVVVSG